jgi:hypothetical protein
MGIPASNGFNGNYPPPAGDLASQVITGALSAIGPGIPMLIVGPFNIAVWGSINTALTTTHGSASASVASGTGIAAGVAINSKNVPPGTTWATFSGTSGTLAFPVQILTGHAKAPNSTIVDLPVSANLAGLLGSTVTGPGIQTATTVTAVDAVNGIATLSAAPTASNTTKSPQFFQFALTNNSVTSGTDSAAIFTGAGVTFSGTVNIERCLDGATWLVANSGGGGSLAQFTAGTPVNLAFGEPERGVLYRVNCVAYTSGTINYRISSSGAATMALAINQLT